MVMMELRTEAVLEFIQWQMCRCQRAVRDTKTLYQREEHVYRWGQWVEFYHLVEDYGSAATIGESLLQQKGDVT